MANQPLISVITPVYNVASYVRRCLDSLVGQTYRNLELICVDDGSTDGSGEICDEYAERDTRIKSIHHDNNRGYPYAINTGLRNAHGDFMAFLDSDDWLELDTYHDVLTRQQQCGADIVVFGLNKDYSDGRSEPMRNELPITSDMFDGHQALLYVFRRDAYQGFTTGLWNKLFRRNVVGTLLMNERLAIGGDNLLVTKFALRAQGLIYLDKPYFHYYQRHTSLTHSLDASLRDSLPSYAAILDILRETHYDDVAVWVKRFYAYMASRLLGLALAQKNAERIRHYQGEIRRYLPEYLATNQEYPDRIERINRLLSIGADQ